MTPKVRWLKVFCAGVSSLVTKAQANLELEGSGISLTAKWPFVYVKTAWFHREEREVGVFCFDTIQHLYINILIIHRETTAFDTLPGVHLCQSRGS